mgnify:CR=1 FL=1
MFRKIVFMGTSYFAISILKSLYQNGYPISVVYTQPPKKSNRGQKLNKSPINLFSENISLNVRTPKVLKNNNEEELYLSELKPDLVIVVSYGQIIPQNLLKIPKNGFLNVHASLLPKWRGAAPMERAILSQDKKIGFSIMKIVSELDAGPYMKQTSFTLNKEMNLGELNKKISSEGAKALVESLDRISTNNFKFIDQDNSKATYAKKIQKKETQINWNNKAEIIIAQVNAFNPNPGAWFIFNNNRIKILKAIEVEKKRCSRRCN